MSGAAAPAHFTVSSEAEHLGRLRKWPVPIFRVSAALLGCAWAYHRLEQALEDLEYLTFAAQPMAPEASAVEASPSAST